MNDQQSARVTALRALLCAAVGAAAVVSAGATPSAKPAAATAALPVVLSAGQLTEAARLRDAALRGTGAFAIVKSLTVEVGPRPAGSAADKAAVAWAVKKLTELGFSNVHTEPVKVPHWERGAAEGWILTPRLGSQRQPCAVLALGGSIGTPEAGLEAPVVRADSLAALAAMDPAAVAGKIVFLDTRMQSTEDITGYAQAVPMRGGGAVAAAKQGAVAVIIRSVGTDYNRLPHTGGMRYDEAVRRIPAAALSAPDADQLDALLATGTEVAFHLRLTARELPQEESANVVGEIPGGESADEVVLLGAHLDSWDPGMGAIDDGAGVAVVTEAARRIGELSRRPRRTIRVVLFANEEFGLSGARAYAEAHQGELPKIMAAAESDLGADPVFRVTAKVPAAALPAVDALAKLLRPLGIERNSKEGDGGADLSTLQGVPIVALEQDARVYFQIHHTANDTLDKVDPTNLDRVVAAFVTFAYVAAQAPGGMRGGS